LAFVAGEKIMNLQTRDGLLLSLVASGICFAAIISAVGQSAPAAAGPAHTQNKAPSATPGEKIFAANCARCHTPPMTLNPRVTGTVVEHMRVRARLSRKDQQLLLNYLAP
jgi:cytochrome c5